MMNDDQVTGSLHPSIDASFCVCPFQVGERIRVILDCDDNTLAFERNYEFLGVAFRGEEKMSVSLY